MPEQGINLAQARDRAQWADTFGGQDTNFVQRARHNEDINGYAEALQAERERQQQELLQTSRTAQALHFGALKQDLAERKAAQAMEVADTRMKNEIALHPIKMEHERQAVSNQASLERRRLSEEAHRFIQEEHENNFFADRASFLTANPNATQEQIDANDISTADRYQHSRKSKAAGEIVTLAERNSLARQQEQRLAARVDRNEPQHNEDGTVRVGSTMFRYDDAGNLVKIGTERAGAEPKKSAAKPETWASWSKELKAAVEAHGGKENVPQEVWQQFEARKAAISGGGTTNAAPKVAERTATNPATGAKMVLRDGKWQPLN